jgi:hypothetical protein
MADTPDITVASGGEDALDQTIAAEKQAQLREIRRTTANLKRKNDKAEMSVSQFAQADPDYQGFWPNNPEGDYHRERNAEIGRNKHSALTAEASRVAADFENDQAVQRQRASEGTEAATDFAKGVTVATMAVTAFVSALNALGAQQKGASITTANMQVALGQSLGGLSRDPSTIESMQTGLVSGNAQAGRNGPVEVAQLYSEFADASAASGIPMDDARFAQFKAIVDNPNIPLSEKHKAAQNPITPGMSAWIRNRFRTGQGGTSSGAQQNLATMSAAQAKVDAAAGGAGFDYARAEQSVERAENAGDFTGKLPVIGGVLRNLAISLNRLMGQSGHDMPAAHPDILRMIEKNTRSVPSTDGGIGH